MGHSNIQGGLTGINKTNDLIDIIREHSIDVLSLNETNLNDSIDTSTLNIPHSHDFIRKDRGKGSRGGCGLLVNKNCNYAPYKINITIDKIEAVWIKLKDAKVFICGFYRSGNYCPVDTFLEYMTECMRKLRGKKVIWIGDINIDQNNVNSAPYKKLDMVLKSFNMVQAIQGYTRIAKRGDTFTKSTIDVCFTNCYSDFQDSSVLLDCPGDHQVIKCVLDFKVKPADKYEKITIRDH